MDQEYLKDDLFESFGCNIVYYQERIRNINLVIFAATKVFI